MFDGNSMAQTYTPFGGMQNGLSMQPPNAMPQHGGMVQSGVMPAQQGMQRLPNPQQIPPQQVT